MFCRVCAQTQSQEQTPTERRRRRTSYEFIVSSDGSRRASCQRVTRALVSSSSVDFTLARARRWAVFAPPGAAIDELSERPLAVFLARLIAATDRA